MSNGSLEYYAKRGMLGLDAHDMAQSGDIQGLAQQFPMIPTETDIQYNPNAPRVPSKLEQTDEHNPDFIEKDSTQDHPLDFDEMMDESSLASNKKPTLGQRIAKNDVQFQRPVNADDTSNQASMSAVADWEKNGTPLADQLKQTGKNASHAYQEMKDLFSTKKK